jgi:hypothetical protein
VTAVGKVACGVAAAVCLSGGAARAQSVDRRADVAFGVRWVGAAGIASSDARLTTPSGGSSILFETRSDLTPVQGFEATFDVRVVSFLRVGVSVSSGRSRMETRITADAEGAPDVTASERITEFAIGGLAVVELPTTAGSRVRPFVSGGVGHLRHLHEGRPLVATGRIYHVGGGVDYVLRTGDGPVLGLRGDLRAALRTRGVFFDNGLHVSPAAAASLFVRF